MYYIYMKFCNKYYLIDYYTDIKKAFNVFKELSNTFNNKFYLFYVQD